MYNVFLYLQNQASNCSVFLQLACNFLPCFLFSKYCFLLIHYLVLPIQTAYSISVQLFKHVFSKMTWNILLISSWLYNLNVQLPETVFHLFEPNLSFQLPVLLFLYLNGSEKKNNSKRAIKKCDQISITVYSHYTTLVQLPSQRSTLNHSKLPQPTENWDKRLL